MITTIEDEENESSTTTTKRLLGLAGRPVESMAEKAWRKIEVLHGPKRKRWLRSSVDITVAYTFQKKEGIAQV